ncbi:MAG TPA: MBL fold metallo-hydrolase [Candidatus Saccharimonadales bacterium]|nr:MBL fold metallo-hydrolase [Candidatus Saccharimonadales bacterium]
MKITKLVHSCLLVEMPAPVSRTALFDPGSMSTVPIDTLEYLDDIIITHSHSDHFDLETVKRLVAKFPNVHITAPDDVVEALNVESIPATSAASEGIAFFASPHAEIQPLQPAAPPPEIGVHYLDKLTHPGDSHTFRETKAILALPVQAPWGSPNDAVKVALELKPRYVIPIHDWHWSDAARASMYERFQKTLAPSGITCIGPVNGEPFVIDL